MTNWIMPLNPNIYEVLKAFIGLNGVIDQPTRNKIHCGDFVFIYLSAPVQKIILKAIVIDENVPTQDLINDYKYFCSDKAHKDFDKKNKNKRYIRLKAVEYLEDEINYELTYKKLKKNGYRGRMQSGIMLERNKPLFDYINKICN